MSSRILKPLGAMCVFALLMGITPPTRTSAEPVTKLRTHEALDAVLWMQTSAEYRMAVSQAFLLAGVMLDRALSDSNWTAALEQTGNYQDREKLAVIIDADETILDNGPFQAKIVIDGVDFNPGDWDIWVKTGNPNALPGAAAFLRLAVARGVDVFYVTNRNHKNWLATKRALEAQSFPVAADGSNLLSKNKVSGWGSDKTTRRAFVAETHRILLLIGDDLNDFVSGVRRINRDDPAPAPEQRRKVAGTYRNYWGNKWIVIPNPVYGSWERALYDYDVRQTRGFKLGRKYPHLKGY